MKQNSSVRDVENILNQLNIYYKKEKTFDDLKYKSKLRFDYYLPKYNLCIEFNGAQHYEYVEYFHKDENEFNEQKLKDYIKSDYCRSHDIHLIELPCSLTSDEIRAELVQFINEHNEEEIELLPEIEQFLKLNESHEIYINQLYAEYKRMLKDLNIDDISNYKIFYNYVIDYWDLDNKSIIIDKKGKYVERWINKNVTKTTQQTINNDNDILMKQLRELEDFGLFNYSHIPTTFLYEHYKVWLKENNPGSKPLKQFDYSRQIKNKLKDFGYTESKRQKHRHIKKEQFDFSAFDEFNLNIDVESLKQATVCINPDLDMEHIMVDIENDSREMSYEEFYDKYNEQMMKSYMNYLVRNNPTVVIDILNDNSSQYKVHEIDEMSYEEIVEYLLYYNQSDERESEE